MTEHEETNKRLTKVEQDTAWLKDKVWYGQGNLHDRTHHLEDRSADRSFEMEKLKEDIKTVKQVVGLEGYGGKNLIGDLRGAIDAVEKVNDSLARMKENVITTKDFQTLLNDVKTLKERGQAQISFWNYIQLGVVMAIINIVIELLKSRVVGP